MWNSFTLVSSRFLSFAWVAALLLVSVYRSFLVLALRLQTCNRKPDFLYLWARKKGGVFIYLFSRKRPSKRKRTYLERLYFGRARTQICSHWRNHGKNQTFFFFVISEVQHDFVHMFFKKKKRDDGWWNSKCRLKRVTVTQKSLQFLSQNYLKISFCFCGQGFSLHFLSYQSDFFFFF